MMDACVCVFGGGGNDGYRCRGRGGDDNGC